MFVTSILTLFIFAICIFASPFNHRGYSKDGTTCHCKNKTLCLPIARRQDKVIAAYTDANDNWSHYDMGLLTELIVTSDIDKIDAQLICLAHAKGVQVHAFVKLTSDVIYEVTVQKPWIQRQVENLKKFNLDGININYEEYIPPKKQTFLIEFFKEMYSVLKTASLSYELSYSASWYLGSEQITLYKELSHSVDYFMLKEFDMSTVVNGPPCNPGPNAPIYKIMSSLQYYLEAGIPLDRLVAALPWYGYLLTCRNRSAEGRCQMDTCKEQLTEQRCYGDVITQYINTGLTEYHWDSTAQSPYLSVRLEGSNLTGEFWFDNGQSLAIKTQAISRGGYRGVAAYSLDCMRYDGSMEIETAEMWSSLAVLQ